MMPWKRTLCSIKQRCLNKKAVGYYRYGGRGIKANITADELRVLWFRDKAYLMEAPSIHRIDNDGNYEFGNCMYVEIDDNVRLIPKKSHCVNGHPLVPENIKTRLSHNYKGSYISNTCRTCDRQLKKNWRSVLKNRLHQQKYIRAWKQRRRQQRLLTLNNPTKFVRAGAEPMTTKGGHMTSDCARPNRGIDYPDRCHFNNPTEKQG